MAVLGSTLLLLCLGTLLIAASSADYPERCMLFNAVRPTATPGIQANTDVYKSGTVYTIFVPVNNNTISVVLRALDTNNSTVGLWDRADQYCNSSVLYYMKDMREGFFRTSWQSPHSVNITTVEIQNDHHITLYELHDQANHNTNPIPNPKSNYNPSRNHGPNPKCNPNSNHNQKLGQQNLPQPHHRCHSDPACLSRQQTPLLEGS
ncbi:PREDICTED: placenta-expressed transcript 1 protein [Miniopterus natalensis]|uniref:placenta-expressed transcript 1 protein n=1 Tax=Miniopterus natalensis TaxID=291302 RepID=UPI0007A6E37D|nr:PREDICTED: placenta-expressed transcript 1 protein [Miniopterus natalensis]